LRISKPEFAEKPKSKNAPIPSVTDALAARDRELDDLEKRLLNTADGNLDCAMKTLLTAVSNAMQLRIAAGEFSGLNVRLSEAAHANASRVFYAIDRQSLRRRDHSPIVQRIRRCTAPSHSRSR